MKLARLTIATTVIGLATIPHWRDEKPKTGMDLLADKIATCPGVTEADRVGRNTQSRIDPTYSPESTP
jgi:hypothetical protein